MAASLTLIVAAQTVAALALDHFGWLGLPVRPITLVKLAGVALIVGGVLLVRRG